MSSKRLLAELRVKNPVLHAVQGGLTPDQVKAEVISGLSPFITDTEFLQTNAIGLTAEYVSLTILKTDPWADHRLRHVLTPFMRDVYNIRREETKAALQDWHLPINEKLSTFWSAYNLKSDLTSLAMDDFVFEAFRTIGTLIEGPMSPYLGLLYDLVAIRQSRRRIRDLKAVPPLGVKVDCVHASGLLADLLCPPPENIMVHQWRNIAQHHSYELTGTEVEVTYGSTNLNHTRLTRDDLLQVVSRLYQLFCVFRCAHALFLIDHVQDLVLPKTPRNPNAILAFMAPSFASQGFEVDDFLYSPTHSILRVRDAIGGDVLVRAFHASQFVYPLWMHTESSVNEVIYLTTEGDARLAIRASSELCERVDKEGLDVVAQYADFYNPVTGRPFESLSEITCGRTQG